MALRFQDERDEVDRAAGAGRRGAAGGAVLIFVFCAAVLGVVSWLSGDTLRSYGKALVIGFACLWAWWGVYPFYYEFRIRTKEIDGKVSAIEEAVKTLTERPRPVFIHEYLYEQAAWRTTERLDGRTDRDIDQEYNPETHDLVVRGIKCFEIGRDYENGLTVPENRELAHAWYRKAVPWYELAAEKGDSYAHERLGDFYSEGFGVVRDTNKAFHWWRESANNGRVSAQYRLGEKYYFGRDVDKNFAEALFWFQIVLASHPAGFVEEKRQARSYGDESASHLTPPVLAEVQERLSKWFEDHPTKPQ